MMNKVQKFVVCNHLYYNCLFLFCVLFPLSSATATIERLLETDDVNNNTRTNSTTSSSSTISSITSTTTSTSTSLSSATSTSSLSVAEDGATTKAPTTYTFEVDMVVKLDFSCRALHSEGKILPPATETDCAQSVVDAVLNNTLAVRRLVEALKSAIPEETQEVKILSFKGSHRSGCAQWCDPADIYFSILYGLWITEAWDAQLQNRIKNSGVMGINSRSMQGLAKELRMAVKNDAGFGDAVGPSAAIDYVNIYDTNTVPPPSWKLPKEKLDKAGRSPSSAARRFSDASKMLLLLGLAVPMLALCRAPREE